MQTLTYADMQGKTISHLHKDPNIYCIQIRTHSSWCGAQRLVQLVNFYFTGRMHTVCHCLCWGVFMNDTLLIHSLSNILFTSNPHHCFSQVVRSGFIQIQTDSQYTHLAFSSLVHLTSGQWCKAKH